MRKNGQGKVDDFKRHFLIFRCWLTSITGLFPSYWRGKFLVFFPRNLSTSSSGDDRPQYAAIFAEEVFVSSSSRSPLKNTTKSNDRWDARRTDFTELWRRESAHSDCNAGLECIELRRWRRRRHHRFFSAIALEKIFFFFLGSPTRCDRARNEKIYSQNNQIFDHNLQSFPSLHVPKILCLVRDPLPTILPLHSLLISWRIAIHDECTDHSRAHQKNQPTSKHRGKKKSCCFFYFCWFFYLFKLLCETIESKYENIVHPIPQCDWTNHQVDPSRTMPTDKNGRQ